jgi:hypothetical protein
MACPASSTLRARSVPKRPRRVVPFAQLTHQQHEFRRRVSDAGKQRSWDLALLWDGVGSYPVPNGAWTTSGGHAGTYKRADRSVMGMLVFTLGLLLAATGKAAAPPRWQTMAPKPLLDRDMRRT